MPALAAIPAWVGYTAMAVGAAAAVYSARESAKASKKAARAQQEQIAIQKQQAELQNIQSTRSMARERYMSQGRVLNIGALTGTSSSSGIAGGVSSIGAQYAGNLSYMSDSADLKDQEFAASMRYASAQSDMGRAQAIGAIGGAFSSLGSYFKK